MANSELRLKIVTALDNAGIKATKEQIDGLEKQLTKVGNSGGKNGLGSLFQIFGRFPGKIGQVSRMLGGFEKSAEQAGKLLPSLGKGFTTVGTSAAGATGGVGKLVGVLGKIGRFAGPIGAVVAALVSAPKLSKGLANMLTDGTGDVSWDNFKSYWSKKWDSFKDGWMNFWTAGTYGEAKEAEKKDKEHELESIKKLQELQDKAFSYSVQNQVEQMKSLQKEQEKVISNIKKATSEYLSQAQTLSNLQTSHNDAKVLMMERQKAADIQSVKNWGWSDEEAAQVEKAWDIRIAERKIRIQDKMGEQAWMVQNTKTQQTALQLEQAMKVTDQAKSNVEAIQKRLDSIVVERGDTRAARRRKSLEKVLEERKLEYEKAVGNEQSLAAQINNDYMTMYDIDQKRANAKFAGMTELGTRISEFERLSYNGSNPLGFQWQENDLEYLTEIFQKSNTDMESTMTNSANIIVDALKELLQMKQ